MHPLCTAGTGGEQHEPTIHYSGFWICLLEGETSFPDSTDTFPDLWIFRMQGCDWSFGYKWWHLVVLQGITLPLHPDGYFQRWTEPQKGGTCCHFPEVSKSLREYLEKNLYCNWNSCTEGWNKPDGDSKLLLGRKALAFPALAEY